MTVVVYLFVFICIFHVQEKQELRSLVPQEDGQGTVVPSGPNAHAYRSTSSHRVERVCRWLRKALLD